MAEYDLIIRGGTVVDGTRLPRFRADVGIKDGRVRKIGRIRNATAGRTLDATGCVVAPGFVDLHTHYDAQIHWDPYCTISGWHGVTSLVLGNCGFGFAPVKAADRERSMMMMTRTEQIPYESMKEGMKWRWETFPEWLENLERLPKGVNIVSYVPVSPLMVYVMGMEAAKSRPATPAERKEMQRLLNEAMDAGACGFSIQRLGAHSLQADFDGTPMPTDCMADEDVLALAEVLRDRDEGFIQITQAQGGDPIHEHDDIRSRDRAFLEKLAEVAQRPILHNAIAVLDDVPTFHTSELDWVHACNERGLRIYGQGANVRTWFSFSLEHWNLYDSSPAWNHATQGNREDKLQKLSDPATREQMRAEYKMLLSIGGGSIPENLTVATTPGHPELEKYVGRKISDIAKEDGKHPNDAMLDIAVAGDLKVVFRTGAATSYDAEKVGPLMCDPYMIAGSFGRGSPHQIFHRRLLYNRLPDLARARYGQGVTGRGPLPSELSASAGGRFRRSRLSARGRARRCRSLRSQTLKRTPEWEFETVHDFPANEWRRIQRSEGYRWTIVNGQITFEDGKCTGATPGQLLRNGKIGVESFTAAAR